MATGGPKIFYPPRWRKPPVTSSVPDRFRSTPRCCSITFRSALLASSLDRSFKKVCTVQNFFIIHSSSSLAQPSVA